jgi:hypothetical protein
MCKSALAKLVYVSGGAIDERGRNKSHIEGFFSIGVHTADSECHENVHLNLVDDVKGGQFDFSFCSVACLRKWFLSVVADLESRETQASNRRPNSRRARAHKNPFAARR